MEKETIVFRPRIYLPQKYSHVVNILQKRIHKKNLASVFFLKILEDLLTDKDISEWEHIIKKIAFSESPALKSIENQKENQNLQESSRDDLSLEDLLI